MSDEKEPEDEGGYLLPPIVGEELIWMMRHNAVKVIFGPDGSHYYTADGKEIQREEGE